ncbi:MAG TPA: YbhB/YbcL family Raf kinase inhibitor-like protein [Chitinophagaceae bacterium]|nr:YbhB/YbcL family Raf kinase inhibitor-like protein [Chitinophagaceae bacterium]
MKHLEKAIDYKTMIISSTVFEDRGMIPVRYTCDGINISPPLDIKNIPEDAKSLVLIVEDPDAPIATWVHWIVWNIPLTHHIKENEIHGTEGLNDFQQHHYGGPCPPSGTHHYFFKIYALDTILDLPPDTRIKNLQKAMGGHIMAFGELVGLYKRRK